MPVVLKSTSEIGEWVWHETLGLRTTADWSVWLEGTLLAGQALENTIETGVCGPSVHLYKITSRGP